MIQVYRASLAHRTVFYLEVFIFDSLRTWNLSPDQSAVLIEAYLPFKGQSKLLDYVMEDYIKQLALR